MKIGVVSPPYEGGDQRGGWSLQNVSNLPFIPSFIRRGTWSIADFQSRSRSCSKNLKLRGYYFFLIAWLYLSPDDNSDTQAAYMLAADFS